jgi:iron complex outermembrane receptor protein
MKRFYKASLPAVLMVLLSTAVAFAQTTISGKVTDANGETVPGASIGIKGLVAGTISDGDGNFTLSVKSSPPLTLVVSSINFKTQEIQITESTQNLEIKLEEDHNVLPEVSVTGGGIFSDETVAKSSFAVEKVRLTDLQKSPTTEVFDVLQHVKGVQFTSGSLNFPAVNTRGFATIANTRFVQMVDGMDTSAPLLNFPTGNIVGIGELDLESMELLPGTSSGIYGPNAFNGLLLMNSKSPFDYQGLSAQFKGGFTTSDAQGGEKFPLFNYGFRYAKAFSNKFAFKVNFNILQGEDWYGTDYVTDVNRPESPINLSKTSNFDALNMYGDDTRIPVPLPAPFNALNDGVPLDLRRTGWKEEFLIDNYDAKSIKGDLALHYRPTDNTEVSFNYRYGGGSSVYQGSQKYALRDFTQQFFKLEVRSKNWFVRGYVTATDAGDSYNMGALGGILNERISPTATQWAPTYAQNWILAMQGYGVYDDGSVVPGGDKEAAHTYARFRADAGRRALSESQVNDMVESVRNDYFQKDPAGAKFKDNSRLYHAQFNYNFADMIKFAEVMVGGNYRQYSLFSDGTIFNEDPENGTDFQRITIGEYGVYGQITKDFDGVIKLIGSIRYDKNENFEGQFTPRASMVYSFGENKNHNFRISYQTGFRNPDSQSQFIYFPVGTNTLVGSTKANAERYNIHHGNAWTRDSYEQYLRTGDESVRVTADIDYIQPEKLSSFDIGYKGTIGTQLFIDANAYFNTYTDFLGSLDVASKEETTHHGEVVPAGTIFSPYVNVTDKVKSQGVGIGITYKIIATKDYILNASYSWAQFDVENTDYRTGFNTPENKYNVSFGNRKLTKNLGFNVAYRWQESFLWESDFGSWEVPEFGVFDAQVSYKITPMKTVVKIGGQNIGGGDFRTNFGSAYVGQQYYISLTFDQFFK